MRGSLKSGTASGKTTFAQRLTESLGVRVTQFSFDNFYRGIPHGVCPSNYDFDHPDALDFDLIFECLTVLLSGRPVDIPQYCFKTHARLSESQRVYPAPIIILEGILVFQDPRILALFDLKIFIQCDSDVALARRLLRDIKERQRDIGEVLSRYHTFVKPDYTRFVLPKMKVVDFTVYSGATNNQAIDIILEFLTNKFGASRKNSFGDAERPPKSALFRAERVVQLGDWLTPSVAAAIESEAPSDEPMRIAVKRLARLYCAQTNVRPTNAAFHCFAKESIFGEVSPNGKTTVFALFADRSVLSQTLKNGFELFFLFRSDEASKAPIFEESLRKYFFKCFERFSHKSD